MAPGHGVKHCVGKPRYHRLAYAALGTWLAALGVAMMTMMTMMMTESAQGVAPVAPVARISERRFIM